MKLIRKRIVDRVNIAVGEKFLSLIHIFSAIVITDPPLNPFDFAETVGLQTAILTPLSARHLSMVPAEPAFFTL